MTTTVTLSLISHTNVGKTTLARTLLRRDVGEVIDQAHVTEENEAHLLIEAPGARLVLWDTPGFGNTGRLLRRLEGRNEPLGWFLRQIWDRVLDRPLFCSQRAVRNVKDEADIVLYLVNASETPESAGYVPPELEILSWIERPVLVLLNQVVGDAAAVETAWRRFLASWPVVRDVLPLDAFNRCWVQEGVLFERTAHLLDGAKREAMRGLSTAWSDRNREVFRASVEALTTYLARTAVDRETLGEQSRRRAMGALDRRLDEATVELMARMIALHGLLGDSAARIERSIRSFRVRGAGPGPRTAAVAGAVVSGALGGLAADALSGGLTLGGGMIAGGILGALGGTALARGYRLVRGEAEPSIRWADEFLDLLLRQALLRYLAVAHFGRGRGGFRDSETPAFWNEALDAALRTRRPIWDDAERESAVRAQLEPLLRGALEDALAAVYPDARSIVDR